MKSSIRRRYPRRHGEPGPLRLTKRGRMALTVCAGLLCLGIVALNAPVIYLALYGIFLVLSAVVVASGNLSGLEYGRVLPDAVYAGEEFDLGLRLCNRKRRLPSFSITISDDVIASHKHAPTLFQAVSGGQTETQIRSARLSHRGVYRRFACRLRSAFPFGLAEHEKEVVLSDSITVFPRPRLHQHARYLLESGLGQGDARRFAASDTIGEFRTLREYQPGDAFKLISWPASARLRKIVVRETERAAPRAISVLFHSYQAPHTVLARSSFERSLQLLSGLFGWLHDNLVEFDFAAPFTRWERIEVLYDDLSLKRALIALATARMSVSTDMEDVSRAVRSVRTTSECLLIVSNSPARFWVPLLPPVSVPAMYMDSREAGMVPAADPVGVSL